MSAFHGELLLIESKNDFIEEVLKDTSRLQENPLLIQKTFLNGMRFFEKQKANIRIVIISDQFFQTEQAFKDFKQNIGDHPYLLLSHKKDHPLQDLFTTEKILINPKSYKDLLDAIKDILEKKPSWQEFEESHDQKFVEIKLSDSDFVSIPIKSFVFLPKSHFNLFIKIGADNFVKVLNAGDQFEQDVINKYSDKGFTHVHMPKAEHQKYMTLCEALSFKKINSPSVLPEEKIQGVFQLGNEISRNFLKNGIDHTGLDYAEAFLNQSVQLMKNLSLKNGQLKKFINVIEQNDHTAAVSFIAGVLANELGFESMKSVKHVGLAALVHDIGLYDLSPEINESKLDPKDELFEKHAKHGADMLRKSGLFEETVCLAVEQHHLRRRGSDPAERTHHMNLVAEIIGVCDSFYNLVLSTGFDQQKLKLFKVQELVKFSHPIEKGFLKILEKKLIKAS